MKDSLPVKDKDYLPVKADNFLMMCNNGLPVKDKLAVEVGMPFCTIVTKQELHCIIAAAATPDEHNTLVYRLATCSHSTEPTVQLNVWCCILFHYMCILNLISLPSP